MLAATLGHDPEVLLLDEPFGGLDPLAHDDVLGAVVDALATAPRTVLVATHDLDVATRLGDRVLVLARGPHRARPRDGRGVLARRCRLPSRGATRDLHRRRTATLGGDPCARSGPGAARSSASSGGRSSCWRSSSRPARRCRSSSSRRRRRLARCTRSRATRSGSPGCSSAARCSRGTCEAPTRCCCGPPTPCVTPFRRSSSSSRSPAYSPWPSRKRCVMHSARPSTSRGRCGSTEAGTARSTAGSPCRRRLSRSTASRCRGPAR